MLCLVCRTLGNWPQTASWNAPSPPRSSPDAVQHFAARPPQRNLQGWRAVGVRRAAQARVLGAYYRRDPVEHAFLHLVAVDEVARHLAHAVVDGQVVVAGGHDQIGPLDGAALIDLVVVDQGAARGFDHTYAFQTVHGGVGAHVRVQNRRVRQQPLDLLQTVQQLDQSRIVVVEGAVDHRAEALAVFGQLAVGHRRSRLLGHVQPRQRAYTVYARGESDRKS